jgi:tetratricopeptide (TPR) repeat protein
LKRGPDLFPLNALYGAILAKLGELDRAYDILQHAHQLNPPGPFQHKFSLCTTLKLAEKHQAARQYPAALGYFGESSKTAARGSCDAPERGRNLHSHGQAGTGY